MNYLIGVFGSLIMAELKGMQGEPMWQGAWFVLAGLNLILFVTS